MPEWVMQQMTLQTGMSAACQSMSPQDHTGADLRDKPHPIGAEAAAKRDLTLGLILGHARRELAPEVQYRLAGRQAMDERECPFKSHQLSGHCGPGREMFLHTVTRFRIQCLLNII